MFNILTKVRCPSVRLNSSVPKHLTTNDNIFQEFFFHFRRLTFFFLNIFFFIIISGFLSLVSLSLSRSVASCEIHRLRLKRPPVVHIFSPKRKPKKKLANQNQNEARDLQIGSSGSGSRFPAFIAHGRSPD